jgi:hypothetical protein
MKKILLVISFLFFCFVSGKITAQAPSISMDSIGQKPSDSVIKKTIKKFNPTTATIRSAILPGLGQIYNKKYWKLPLVYGALGTTAAIYFYNVKNYRSLKQAYIYLTDNNPGNDSLVDPSYSNLSVNAIRSYRNSFRQNVDYSVLFFIVFWGLNVVDATVDAHLKLFDVNDDLSLQLKPGYSPLSNTTGLHFVLNIGQNKTSR